MRKFSAKNAEKYYPHASSTNAERQTRLVIEKSKPEKQVRESKLEKKSMDLLFYAFLVVDEAFNTRRGLTAKEIVTLGYFGDKSTVIAIGPPARDVCGHTDHTNQPGVFQSF